MKNLFVFLVVALLAMSACKKAETTAETKAMVQSSIDEIWNQGNLDKAAELFTDDYIRHNPKSMEPNVPAEVKGLQAFKDHVQQVRTTYPDFNVKVEAIIVEGDMVASRWTASGTDKDSNKQFTTEGVSVTRLAQGKIAEDWVSWDTHLVMQQLGLIPTSQTTEK